MTTTSFNVGLSDDARLSSRVLRPPGGGHTDIFGGEPEPLRTGRRFAAQGNAQIDHLGPEKSAKAPEEPHQNAPVNNDDPAQTQAPVNKDEQKQDLPKTEPPNAEPTKPATEVPKRVRVPPGGFSSGLW